MSVGAGTLLYGIAAGALAATAFVYTLIAILRRRDQWLFFAVGLFGLAGAVATVVAVWMQTSPTVEVYAERLQVFGFVGLVGVMSTVLLVQAWTQAISRSAMILFLVWSGVVGVLQIVLPEGLLAADITGLRAVSLLDEQFVVHEGSSSPFRPVLDLYLLFTVGLIAVALARLIRRGPRAEGLLLTSAIAVFYAISLYDSLVDQGVVSTPYLAPFGSVVVVAAAGWQLARWMASAERRLAQQADELEATVIERTAALIDANRLLEDQVARQRLSARRLSALARQFDAVNAVALDPRDEEGLERSLAGVLENLGDLLEAGEVVLQVTDTRPGPVIGSVSWRRDGAVDGATSLPAPVAEEIAIGARQIGELSVRPAPGRTISDEESRHIELTADLLAGFIDRLELRETIASTAADAERDRIARELHDSVTQKLYSVAFLADAVPAVLQEDPARAAEIVARVRQLLLASLAELRALLFELQPRAFEKSSLPKLLQQLGETFDSGTEIDVRGSLHPIQPLPSPVKMAFYRISQEALNNAVRHSGSTSIQLDLREQSGSVLLCVRDEGTGFARDMVTHGQGLTNMQERAASVGATLEVAPIDGRGTAVQLSWPRPDAEDVVR